MFVFLKYNGERIISALRLVSLVNFIRPATFGIYLLHMYFLYLTMSPRGLGSFLNPSSILYRTVGAVVIFLLVAVVVRLLQWSRIVRIVLPK